MKPKSHIKDISSALILTDRNHVISEMVRWTLPELLRLSETDRQTVVTLLIQKGSEFNLTMPPFWNDIVSRPEYYSERAKDAFGMGDDILGGDEDTVDTHPTCAIEPDKGNL